MDYSRGQYLQDRNNDMADRFPILAFQDRRDVKGWIVMVFMITFGVTMRSFHILPDAFISVFYTGLSLALIFTGVLFIRYWWINRKGNLFTPPPEE